MADISAYESKLVSTSKSVLLEVFTLLSEYKDFLVLVGGWVPFLLLEKYKPEKVDFQHIGSIDIDIVINHSNFPGLDEVYESIRGKLEKSGYKTRKSRDGQEIPHSMEKEFQGSLVHIDFLASEVGGTSKQHRYQRVQDILAFKSKGIDLAFWNKEIVTITGLLPGGAKYIAEISVAGTAAIITMKSLAFSYDVVTRVKDIYDIYSIFKYYKNGIESIVKEVNPFLKNNLFLEGIQKLGNSFIDIDSVGPIGLANFMLPENKGSEDWEFFRRDVFELVQEFIGKVKEVYLGG